MNGWRAPHASAAPVHYDEWGHYRRVDSAPDSSPGVLPSILLGRDHDGLGQVALRSLGDHIGMALTRGAEDKPHWYVHPNEDGALVASGRSGWLLAVADGHHGADAAEAALAGVASACPALDDGWSSPELIVQWAVDAARSFVTERLRYPQGAHPGSRTALSVAVVAGDSVSFATYGDTSVFRVRRFRAKELGSTSAFLGPRSPAVPVRTARLRRRDRLVLASDGLADSLGKQPWSALRIAPGEQSAGGTARQLVCQALHAQARDNVTAVVWAPFPGRECAEERDQAEWTT